MTLLNLKHLLFAALLVSCLLQPAHAKSAHHLRIGISQYPSTLHPMFDAMVAKSLVLGPSLRSVTAHDASWQMTCLLCTELPSFENGRAKKITLPDGNSGIAARYTLKDDLFWADGKPLTSADIRFAWSVGKHPQSGVGNGEFFSKDIHDITVEDAQNFTVVFSKEKCEFSGIGDLYPLPAHLEEEIFQSDPANYKNKTLYNTAPHTPGLYMGPYKITDVAPGAHITLEKNPHWQGKQPSFEKISFRTIENSAALSANLLSGEIDYIAGELGLTLDQALSFEKRLPKGKFTVHYHPSLTYEHIDLPLDKPPFDDVRIRQALMYAMNRDAINVRIFDGRQPVAVSNVNPQDTVFTKDVMLYPHDPERAAALLNDAGWMLRDDGFRYNPEGEKLALSLMTTAGNRSRETIQQALQADWRKIGIQADIQNEPARVLFGDTMRNRSFTGGVMYAWMSAPRNIPKTTLYSTMIPGPENNYAGQNYTAYTSAEMDKLIDDLDVVCEKDANLKLWHDLQKLYAQDLPALPLYYRADPFVIPVWLKGILPTGHLNPSTLWIENWEISP